MYAALPEDSGRYPYHEMYLGKAEDLNDAYKAYVTLHGSELKPMDSKSFGKFMADQKNLTLSAATSLADGEEHVPTADEMEALEELYKAGVKFEESAPSYMNSMAVNRFSDFDVWYPYHEEAIAMDEVDNVQMWLDYGRAHGIEDEIFLASRESLINKKRAFYTYVEETPSLKAFAESEYFEKWYFPAMVKKGGMPEAEVI